MSARGEVVQQVATVYLRVIADASNVDNAAALVKADELQYENARAAHQAGTAANLDELRAKVQLQTEQQELISAQNNKEKDLILLKREIGFDPGQKIVLTDPAPYSDLAEETPAEVRATAYKNRQDYQNLQNQVVELRAIHSAYKAQRLPSLSFNGDYGVQKVNGSPSHGCLRLPPRSTFRFFARRTYAGKSMHPQRNLRPRTPSLTTCEERSTSRCARRCSIPKLPESWSKFRSRTLRWPSRR